MRKPRRFVLSFVLLGLLVAYASYAYAALHDYSKPETGLQLTLVGFALLLCPPQLIFAACIDCEVIGGLNAALYAFIGAAIVGLRSRGGYATGAGALRDGDSTADSTGNTTG